MFWRRLKFVAGLRGNLLQCSKFYCCTGLVIRTEVLLGCACRVADMFTGAVYIIEQST